MRRLPKSAPPMIGVEWKPGGIEGMQERYQSPVRE
jgi:hypothetical protein